MVSWTSMFTIRSVHRSINFLSSYSSRISLYVMHVLAFWQVTLKNGYDGYDDDHRRCLLTAVSSVLKSLCNSRAKPSDPSSFLPCLTVAHHAGDELRFASASQFQLWLWSKVNRHLRGGGLRSPSAFRPISWCNCCGDDRTIYSHRVSTGTQSWPEEDNFRGDFVRNYRHGQGRYYWANGEVSHNCRIGYRRIGLLLRSFGGIRFQQLLLSLALTTIEFAININNNVSDYN